MARASASASAASSSSASDSLTKALFMVFIVPAAGPSCGMRTRRVLTYDQAMPPRPRSLRNRLLSPLVVAGALLLLLEEWCWELGLALARRLAGWPPFAALDRRIAALPPYPALCLFVLPALLLLPVKLLALFAIAAGYPVMGVAVFVIAKIGGAALVARVYVLTCPTLLTLAWFARWHNAFILLKDDWLGRLRATTRPARLLRRFLAIFRARRHKL